MSRYTRIDSGHDDHGRPWQVGLSNRVDRPPTLVVTVPEGTAALYFSGGGAGRFAKAVASAEAERRGTEMVREAADIAWDRTHPASDPS